MRQKLQISPTVRSSESLTAASTDGATETERNILKFRHATSPRQFWKYRRFGPDSFGSQSISFETSNWILAAKENGLDAKDEEISAQDGEWAAAPPKTE